MTMSKKTSKTRSFFDYENESIALMDEILAQYSHTKLECLYQDQNIAKIFGYFVENCLEDFVKKYPAKKRRVLREYALEMNEKFREFKS